MRLGHLVAIIALSLPAAAATAGQVDLTTGDAVLDGGAELKDPSAGSGITNSGGDGSTGNPWLYEFTAAGGGLELNGFNILTTDTDGANTNSIKLDLAGEDIIATGGGGIVTTHGGANGTENAGWIFIDNAGNVQVGILDTRANISGPVGSVNPGDISITANGYVKITDGANAGDILSWTRRPTGSGHKGNVTINHEGEFLANIIDSHTSNDNYSSAGHVTLNGDKDSNGASGELTVAAINTYHGQVQTNSNFRRNAGDIHISGYTKVTIGDPLNPGGVVLDAHAINGHTTWHAGDVTIAGITGDVIIAGETDLRDHANDPNGFGTLSITADGTITFKSGLDLSLIGVAMFDSGPTTTIIEGLITGADGNPADGTNLGNLRTPSGDTILYDPLANPSLGGGTFTLADLDGNAGAGGTLTPVPEPATLALLGLGGLAMVGSAVRRRRR